MWLECNVMDDRKIVEIWLTNEEKKNIALWEMLKPMVTRYKAEKYTVVVFESGGQNLEQMTSALLLYNRKCSAENEIRKENATVREAAFQAQRDRRIGKI